MKNQSSKEHQRLEQTIREKIAKGWNAFSRTEMEAILEMLYAARRAKTALYQRIHTSHGDAVGWHLDGDIGLHERRPAPEGAINLFQKPVRLDFPRGWRIPVGVKVRGWKVTKDGRLVQYRNRTPQSPNDVMRHLHQTLNDLSYGYKQYEQTNRENLQVDGETSVGSGESDSPVE